MTRQKITTIFMLSAAVLIIAGKPADSQVVDSTASRGMSVGSRATRGSSTLSDFRRYSSSVSSPGAGSGRSSGTKIQSLGSGISSSRSSRTAGRGRIKPTKLPMSLVDLLTSAPTMQTFGGAAVGQTLSLAGTTGIKFPTDRVGPSPLGLTLDKLLQQTTSASGNPMAQMFGRGTRGGFMAGSTKTATSRLGRKNIRYQHKLAQQKKASGSRRASTRHSPSRLSLISR